MSAGSQQSQQRLAAEHLSTGDTFLAYSSKRREPRRVTITGTPIRLAKEVLLSTTGGTWRLPIGTTVDVITLTKTKR